MLMLGYFDSYQRKKDLLPRKCLVTNTKGSELPTNFDPCPLHTLIKK